MRLASLARKFGTGPERELDLRCITSSDIRLPSSEGSQWSAYFAVFKIKVFEG